MMNKRPSSEWRSFLRKNGIRQTRAREAILSALSGREDHPSAEEIYHAVHLGFPNIGLTTVYRTLNILAGCGLVCQYDFGDGRARFELIKKPHGPAHHHHLVCTGCRRVYDYTDFVEEELELVGKTEKALSRRYDFEIRDHVIQFYGLCGDCRRSQD